MPEPSKEKIMQYILANSAERNYNYGTQHSNIAKKIMVELVKAGYADFILLRDDEVNKWWSGLVATATKAFTEHEEKMRMYEIKNTAYEKLTEEDRKVLGVRKPAKPKALKL